MCRGRRRRAALCDLSGSRGRHRWPCRSKGRDAPVGIPASLRGICISRRGRGGGDCDRDRWAVVRHNARMLQHCLNNRRMVGGGHDFRKSSSHPTRRWRKPDSNSQSHLNKKLSEGARSVPPTSGDPPASLTPSRGRRCSPFSTASPPVLPCSTPGSRLGSADTGCITPDAHPTSSLGSDLFL